MVAFKIHTAPRPRGPRAGARAQRDPMSVLEAAYDLNSSEREWLAGVATAIRPLLDQGLGVYASAYAVSRDASTGTLRYRMRSTARLGCPPDLIEALEAATELARPEEMAALYFGRPCQSVSQAFTRLNGRPGVESLAVRCLVERIGVQDQLAVIASEADGSGCAFSGLTDRVMRFPPRKAGVLSRVARHIAAALRLRRALARSHASSLDVDAVFSESGALLHAEAQAKGKSELRTLSTAARMLGENRARLRKNDPERAVELWTALVEGKWSLVDTQDSDGKRFLVARRNAPDLTDPAALLPEERHVLALAARGHSLKLITYELGLAVPTVSERLGNGLRKLGLRSRAELTRYVGVRESPR